MDDRGRIIALVNATLLGRRNLHDDNERKLVEMRLVAKWPPRARSRPTTCHAIQILAAAYSWPSP